MIAKKIIDICNLDTYPKELVKVLKENASDDECYKIIKDYYLLSFHFTRLCSKSDVENNGLKRFDINETLNHVMNVYNKIYDNEEECLKIKEAVNDYIKIYDSHNEDGTISNSRKNKLCFVSGCSKKLKEYEFFSELFGGELISNSTKKYGFHDKLINIGKPYCVMFYIPIKYINMTSKGNQISSLIEIMKNNYNCDKRKLFDGYLYNMDISNKLIWKIITIEELNKMNWY